ncbi:MAG TPA: hypothetical protein VMI32_05615 [Candidatus Solibacter sp.]|nr:hypothetical protein [Candidatus Solibacter sp.]
MDRNKFGTSVMRSVALLALLAAASPTKAQEPKTPYPSMAPLAQYLMPDRNEEIKLARSAAPDSISRDAEVLVLGTKGYENSVQGKNGFVCLVERSWTAGINAPEFWNPKIRGPLCLNPPAVRSYLPRTIKKTELVIAGRSKTQMFQAIEAAIDKKELPSPEPGAMSYMLSKQGYLGDQAAGPWLPHLMFFTPKTDSLVWGADLPGSPIITFQNAEERLTVFLIPVRRWSDGTTALPQDQH